MTLRALSSFSIKFTKRILHWLCTVTTVWHNLQFQTTGNMIDSPPFGADHYFVLYIWLFAVPFDDRSCKLCLCCNLYFLLLLKCLQHRQQAIIITIKVKVRVSAIMPKLRISPYAARNIIKGWGIPWGMGENPMLFPAPTSLPVSNPENFFSLSPLGLFKTVFVFVDGQTSLSDVHATSGTIVAVADSCCFWHWTKSKIINIIWKHLRQCLLCEEYDNTRKEVQAIQSSF